MGQRLARTHLPCPLRERRYGWVSCLGAPPPSIGTHAPLLPVAGIGMVIALSKSPIGAGIFSGNITLWFAFLGSLTCIANLYSVVMISWKAW